MSSKLKDRPSLSEVYTETLILRGNLTVDETEALDTEFQAKLQAALESGSVLKCLHHFVPRPGDCVFLPAGTVHAVGGGVLVSPPALETHR